MHLVVLNWIGLVVSTGLGIFAGVRLLKYLGRHELPDQAEGHASGFLTDALAYVSGVLGIMLGLLLFFSVGVRGRFGQREGRGARPGGRV